MPLAMVACPIFVAHRSPRIAFWMLKRSYKCRCFRTCQLMIFEVFAMKTRAREHIWCNLLTSLSCIRTCIRVLTCNMSPQKPQVTPFARPAVLRMKLLQIIGRAFMCPGSMHAGRRAADAHQPEAAVRQP